MRIPALLAATLFACCAFAQAPASPPASPPAKIDAMAWLAGYWEGEGMGGKIEDIWMPPRDGVILGAFRLTKPDGKGFYEGGDVLVVELTIRMKDGSTRTEAQRFRRRAL